MVCEIYGQNNIAIGNRVVIHGNDYTVIGDDITIGKDDKIKGEYVQLDKTIMGKYIHGRRNPFYSKMQGENL